MQTNATIIDGKKVCADVLAHIREDIASALRTHRAPSLVVVLVGNDPASEVYVRRKHTTCNELGIQSTVHRLPESTTQAELLALVHQLNTDPAIDGILVQLPLPKHIAQDAIIAAINPLKDVDCFHPENCGLLFAGTPRFMPCTPAGVMELLRAYSIPVAGTHAVIIGRSAIVGKPLAMLMLNAHATVTICHSKTNDLSAITRHADILVAALGKPQFVTEDMVKEGAVVIDVGINRINGKLMGDVAFDSVAHKAAYITPVPGGVGQMTIAMLMQNTMTAYKIKTNSKP